MWEARGTKVVTSLRWMLPHACSLLTPTHSQAHGFASGYQIWFLLQFPVLPMTNLFQATFYNQKLELNQPAWLITLWGCLQCSNQFVDSDLWTKWPCVRSYPGGISAFFDIGWMQSIQVLNSFSFFRNSVSNNSSSLTCKCGCAHQAHQNFLFN